MKSLNRLLLILLTALAAIPVSSCSPAGEGAAKSGKLTVVTTTTMVTDLLRSVGGDAVTVEPLMGAGVDPHLFKPAQEDIQKLQRADVIFYSGLHLEGRMAELLERLEKQGRKVYALAGALESKDIIKADGGEDPHIWGDAAQWARIAVFAGDKLAAAMPEAAGAQAVRERTAAAVRELEAAHGRTKALAETLPAEKRVLITSHDAFRYFGRAYGFDVVGVQGISTVSEAALADMARITDLVRQRGVKAVFVESSVSHATIERISKDTGAKIGGELYSDALGAPGDVITIGDRKVDRGTVAGMLESNMHTIVEALR